MKQSAAKPALMEQTAAKLALPDHEEEEQNGEQNEEQNEELDEE